MNWLQNIIQAEQIKQAGLWDSVKKVAPTAIMGLGLLGTPDLSDAAKPQTQPKTQPALVRMQPKTQPAPIQTQSEPAPQDIVTVPGASRPIQLHKDAANAYKQMLQAARAAGIKEPLLLPTSGYRSSARQQELWQEALKKYKSEAAARKWVAPPGKSAHQSGKAIDFHLGGSNNSKNVNQLRTLPAYKWLAANAANFGFKPYPAEPWHWVYSK